MLKGLARSAIERLEPYIPGKPVEEVKGSSVSATS
jgi:hypothetical protein